MISKTDGPMRTSNSVCFRSQNITLGKVFHHRWELTSIMTVIFYPRAFLMAASGAAAQRCFGKPVARGVVEAAPEGTRTLFSLWESSWLAEDFALCQLPRAFLFLMPFGRWRSRRAVR